jgi:hypothetical protein
MSAFLKTSRRPSVRLAWTVLVSSFVLSACDLTETSITEPQANVVVEAFVRVYPGENGFAFALIHGSVGVPGANPDGPEALVRLVAESGAEVVLTQNPRACIHGPGPEPDPRRCYAARLDPGFARPLDRLVLEVDVVGGGRIEGGTVVPGAFEWAQPSGGDACAVATGEVMLSWTQSENSWAYLADVLVEGLAPGLTALGVENPLDEASYAGLTVTSADTAISFPEDFSSDDDFYYEQPLSDLIEGGMQPGWIAEVWVVAIDRNFTNWVRQGVFNPSGNVRIPSLRGAGTGVFGSSVVLERRIAGSPDGCP